MWNRAFQPQGGAVFGFAGLASASGDQPQGVITGVSRATEAAAETAPGVDPSPAPSVASSVDESPALSTSRHSLSARRSTRSASSSQTASPVRATRAPSFVSANDDWENLLNDTSSPRKPRSKRKSVLRVTSLDTTPPLAPIASRSFTHRRERPARMTSTETGSESRLVRSISASYAPDVTEVAEEEIPALETFAEVKEVGVTQGAPDMSRKDDPISEYVSSIAAPINTAIPSIPKSPVQEETVSGSSKLASRTIADDISISESATTLPVEETEPHVSSSKNVYEKVVTSAAPTDSPEVPTFMSGWSGAAGWGDDLDLDDDEDDDALDAWDIGNIESPTPPSGNEAEKPTETLLPDSLSKLEVLDNEENSEIFDAQLPDPVLPDSLSNPEVLENEEESETVVAQLAGTLLPDILSKPEDHEREEESGTVVAQLSNTLHPGSLSLVQHRENEKESKKVGVSIPDSMLPEKAQDAEKEKKLDTAVAQHGVSLFPDNLTQSENLRKANEPQAVDIHHAGAVLHDSSTQQKDLEKELELETSDEQLAVKGSSPAAPQDTQNTQDELGEPSCDETSDTLTDIESRTVTKLRSDNDSRVPIDRGSVPPPSVGVQKMDESYDAWAVIPTAAQEPEIEFSIAVDDVLVIQPSPAADAEDIALHKTEQVIETESQANYMATDGKDQEQNEVHLITGTVKECATKFVREDASFAPPQEHVQESMSFQPWMEETKPFAADTWSFSLDHTSSNDNVSAPQAVLANVASKTSSTNSSKKPYAVEETGSPREEYVAIESQATDDTGLGWAWDAPADLPKESVCGEFDIVPDRPDVKGGAFMEDPTAEIAQQQTTPIAPPGSLHKTHVSSGLAMSAKSPAIVQNDDENKALTAELSQEASAVDFTPKANPENQEASVESAGWDWGASNINVPESTFLEDAQVTSNPLTSEPSRDEAAMDPPIDNKIENSGQLFSHSARQVLAPKSSGVPESSEPRLDLQFDKQQVGAYVDNTSTYGWSEENASKDQGTLYSSAFERESTRAEANWPENTGKGSVFPLNDSVFQSEGQIEDSRAPLRSHTISHDSKTVTDFFPKDEAKVEEQAHAVNFQSGLPQPSSDFPVFPPISEEPTGHQQSYPQSVPGVQPGASISEYIRHAEVPEDEKGAFTTQEALNFKDLAMEADNNAPASPTEKHAVHNSTDFSTWTWSNDANTQASDTAWPELNIADDKSGKQPSNAGETSAPFAKQLPASNDASFGVVQSFSKDAHAQYQAPDIQPQSSFELPGADQTAVEFIGNLDYEHRNSQQEFQVAREKAAVVKTEVGRFTGVEENDLKGLRKERDPSETSSFNNTAPKEVLEAFKGNLLETQVPQYGVPYQPSDQLSLNSFNANTAYMSNSEFKDFEQKPNPETEQEIDQDKLIEDSASVTKNAVPHRGARELNFEPFQNNPTVGSGWSIDDATSSSNHPNRTCIEEKDKSALIVSSGETSAGPRLDPLSSMTWAWKSSDQNVVNESAERLPSANVSIPEYAANESEEKSYTNDTLKHAKFASERPVPTVDNEWKNMAHLTQSYMPSQATASETAEVSVNYRPSHDAFGGVIGEGVHSSKPNEATESSSNTPGFWVNSEKTSENQQMRVQEGQKKVESSAQAWEQHYQQPDSTSMFNPPQQSVTLPTGSRFAPQSSNAHRLSPQHNQDRMSPQIPAYIPVTSSNPQLSISHGSPYPPSAISSPPRSESGVNTSILNSCEEEYTGISYAPKSHLSPTRHGAHADPYAPVRPPLQTRRSSSVQENLGVTAQSSTPETNKLSSAQYGSSTDVAADLWSTDYGQQLKQSEKASFSPSYSPYVPYNQTKVPSVSSPSVSEKVWSEYSSKDIKNSFVEHSNGADPFLSPGHQSYATPSNDKVPGQEYQLSFSIMDDSAPADIRTPRSLISWGFGGSLIVHLPNKASSVTCTSTTRNNVGSICVYEMSSVGSESTNEDWIASIECVGALCAPSSEPELLPFAEMCERLANYVMVGHRDSSESISFLWRLLAVMCRNPHGNWYNQFASILAGPASIPLFDRGNQGLAVDSPLRTTDRNAPSGEAFENRARAASQVERLLCSGKREESLVVARNAGLWSLAFVISASLNQKAYMKTMSDFARESLLDGTATQTLCLSMAENDQELIQLSTTAEGVRNWKKTVSVLLERLSSSKAPAREMQVIENIGNALLLHRQDFAAAHICFLICGKIKSLALGEGNVGMLGADSAIPSGRPSSFGSMIPIMQSLVYEAVYHVQHRQHFPHLLPFRLVVAHNLVNIGKVDVARQHCEAIITSVRNILEKTNPREASKYFTPPFLSSLESLDSRLRNRLGANSSESSSRFKALKQSFSSVFKKSTEALISSSRPVSSASVLGTSQQGTPPPAELSANHYQQTTNLSHQPHLLRNTGYNYQTPLAPSNVPSITQPSAEPPKAEGASKTWDSIVASTIKVLAPAEGDLSPPPVRPKSDMFSNQPYLGDPDNSSAQSSLVSHMRSASVGDVPSVVSGHNVPNFSTAWNQGQVDYVAGAGTSNYAQSAVSRQSNQDMPQIPSGRSENGIHSQSSTFNETGSVPTHRRSVSDRTHDMQTSEKRPPRPPKKTGSKIEENMRDPDDKSASENKPGARGSRWAWRSRFAARLRETFGAPKQAHMGEKNAFVYDKEKGRWLIPGEAEGDVFGAPPPPPDDEALNNSVFNTNDSIQQTPDPSMGTVPTQGSMPQSDSWQSLGPSMRVGSSASASQNGYADNLSESSVASAASAPVPVSNRYADMALGPQRSPANKYRAGRSKLSGRRAYVDTFNLGNQSASMAPVPPVAPFAPLRPPARVGAVAASTLASPGVNIFTPAPMPANDSRSATISSGRMNTSTSFDDNVSSGSVNEMSNAGSASTSHAQGIYTSMGPIAQRNSYPDTATSMAALSSQAGGYVEEQQTQGVRPMSAQVPSFRYGQRQDNSNSSGGGPRMSA